MRRFVSIVLIICFSATLVIAPQPVHAQSINDLPVPGTMVNLSPAFEPVLIKGLKIHPENPFAFDFILDTGDDRAIRESPLREESQKLIKYFLAAMTIREKDLWVNLSPYEKNRMIADNLGQTEMGRDMLAQDYILKQLTASLIYPEKELGKKFWDNVYQKTQQIYGSNAQIPVNTFNKVWIVADKADVFERGNVAYIVGAHLKVMMEEDYLALQKQLPLTLSLKIKRGENVAKSPLFDKEGIKGSSNNINTIASQIIREVIIPEIEKEVNTGKNFAPLRQMFYSMILASWYKMALKDSLLTQVYGNQSKVKVGINTNAPQEKDKIFQRYLQAYKKGVFNYIKEDQINNSLPRKYFSGGVDGAMLAHTIRRFKRMTQPVTTAGLIFLASVNVFASNNTPSSNPTPIPVVQTDAAMSNTRVFVPTDKITFRGGVNKDALKSFTATMKEVMGSLENNNEYIRKSRSGFSEPRSSLSKKFVTKMISKFPIDDQRDIQFLKDESVIQDAVEEFLWVIKGVQIRKEFIQEASQIFAVLGDVIESKQEMTLANLKNKLIEMRVLSLLKTEEDKDKVLTAVLWTLPKFSKLNIQFKSSTGSILDVGKKLTLDSPIEDLELLRLTRYGLSNYRRIKTVGQIDLTNLDQYRSVRGIEKGGVADLKTKLRKYGFLNEKGKKILELELEPLIIKGELLENALAQHSVYWKRVGTTLNVDHINVWNFEHAQAKIFKDTVVIFEQGQLNVYRIGSLSRGMKYFTKTGPVEKPKSDQKVLELVGQVANPTGLQVHSLSFGIYEVNGQERVVALFPSLIGQILVVAEINEDKVIPVGFKISNTNLEQRTGKAFSKGYNLDNIHFTTNFVIETNSLKINDGGTFNANGVAGLGQLTFSLLGDMNTELFLKRSQGSSRIEYLKLITEPSKNAAMTVPMVNQAEITHGGIDLDRSKMNMNVRKDAAMGGVDMVFDPAMVERIRREGFDGLEFKIESIIPVTNLSAVLGI